MRGFALLLIFASSNTLAAPSYFELGPYSQAQQQIARGDCISAMRALRAMLQAAPDASEAPQARYLLGLCLIEVGEYPEAERLFGELVATYPALRDDHLFLRGQALYLWGNKLEASRVLAAVDSKSTRGQDAARLRSKALLEASDFATLRDWLEDKLSEEGRLENELLYALGESRFHTGDSVAALPALREVWREAPAEPYAARALATITQLRAGGRALIDRADEAAIRSLEADLLKGRAAAVALADLARRLSGRRTSQALRAEVAYARGRVAESARRLREAVQRFEEAVSIAPAEMVDLRARATLRQARVAALYGQDERALTLYQLVADQFPDQPEAEEALLGAGEILLGRRAYELAQTRFETLMIKNPVTKFRSNCLWGLGWIRYRLGRYEEAQRFFGSLVRLALPPELDAASRYWLARTEAELGHPDVARAGFRAVIERHPTIFYAALAEDQLAEAMLGRTLPSASRTAQIAATPPALVGVEEYIRLGLLPRARTALADAEKSVRRGKLRPDEAMLRHLARLYDRVGQNGEARRIREEVAREYPHALSSEEQQAASRRTHPIKFEPEIRDAAGEFSISEALLLALVRTESNFQLNAASPASAYGLAQLIIPTAREVAARLKMRAPSRAVLISNARVNVRLGAAYLRELLDRYEGSEPLALAAYNAGPNAVDAWLEKRVRPLAGVGPAGKGVGLMPAPDELVEEIPVAETRAYVKTVLARARWYARLIAVPAPRASPEPPALDLLAGVEVEPAELPVLPSAVRELPPGARVIAPPRSPNFESARIFSTRSPP